MEIIVSTLEKIRKGSEILIIEHNLIQYLLKNRFSVKPIKRNTKYIEGEEYWIKKYGKVARILNVYYQRNNKLHYAYAITSQINHDGLKINAKRETLHFSLDSSEDMQVLKPKKNKYKK